MTERAQTQIFADSPLIFADSPFLLEIQAFGGREPAENRGSSQKTADLRRKPMIFAEDCRKPQTGLRHLRSFTFSLALVSSVSECHFQSVTFRWGISRAPGSCLGTSPCTRAKATLVHRSHTQQNKVKQVSFIS